MSRVAAVGALFVALFATSAGARTWHINAAGTGDAPTIAAGVDSAVAGDTILVAPGTYAVRDIVLGPGVVLTSEGGPTVTRITEEAADVTYGVVCSGYPPGSPSSEVSGFWFEGFTAPVGAVGVFDPSTNATIEFCVFTGNDYGIVTALSCHATVRNCTFVGLDEIDEGLHVAGGEVHLEYSIMWDHQIGGVYAVFVDYLYPGERGINLLAFSLDPQFCGPLVGNYYLQDDSPCAPGNFDPMVGLIGALPVACGPVKTEPSSWGKVKSLYR
jgi:hypothetical protein